MWISRFSTHIHCNEPTCLDNGKQHFHPEYAVDINEQSPGKMSDNEFNELMAEAEAIMIDDENKQVIKKKPEYCSQNCKGTREHRTKFKEMSSMITSALNDDRRKALCLPSFICINHYVESKDVYDYFKIVKDRPQQPECCIKLLFLECSDTIEDNKTILAENDPTITWDISFENQKTFIRKMNVDEQDKVGASWYIYPFVKDLYLLTKPQDIFDLLMTNQNIERPSSNEGLVISITQYKEEIKWLAFDETIVLASQYTPEPELHLDTNHQLLTDNEPTPTTQNWSKEGDAANPLQSPAPGQSPTMPQSQIHNRTAQRSSLSQAAYKDTSKKQAVADPGWGMSPNPTADQNTFDIPIGSPIISPVDSVPNQASQWGPSPGIEPVQSFTNTHNPSTQQSRSGNTKVDQQPCKTMPKATNVPLNASSIWGPSPGMEEVHKPIQSHAKPIQQSQPVPQPNPPAANASFEWGMSPGQEPQQPTLKSPVQDSNPTQSNWGASPGMEMSHNPIKTLVEVSRAPRPTSTYISQLKSKISSQIDPDFKVPIEKPESHKAGPVTTPKFVVTHKKRKRKSAAHVVPSGPLPFDMNFKIAKISKANDSFKSYPVHPSRLENNNTANDMDQSEDRANSPFDQSQQNINSISNNSNGSNIGWGASPVGNIQSNSRSVANTTQNNNQSPWGASPVNNNSKPAANKSNVSSWGPSPVQTSRNVQQQRPREFNRHDNSSNSNRPSYDNRNRSSTSHSNTSHWGPSPVNNNQSNTNQSNNSSSWGPSPVRTTRPNTSHSKTSTWGLSPLQNQQQRPQYDNRRQNDYQSRNDRPSTSHSSNSSWRPNPVYNQKQQPQSQNNNNASNWGPSPVHNSQSHIDTSRPIANTRNSIPTTWGASPGQTNPSNSNNQNQNSTTPSQSNFKPPVKKETAKAVLPGWGASP